MNKTMFDIEDEFRAIERELEDCEGELTDDLATRMAINDDDIVHKTQAYVAIIKETDGTIAAIDAEIKRLQARKKTLQNKQGWLKQVLHSAVVLFGPVQTDLFKVGLRKSTAVDVTNESLIPAKYVEQVTTIKVDKVSIGKDLRQGIIIPGTQLIENENLSIK